MYRLVRALIRFLLDLFYARIEVVGAVTPLDAQDSRYSPRYASLTFGFAATWAEVPSSATVPVSRT